MQIYALIKICAYFIGISKKCYLEYQLAKRINVHMCFRLFHASLNHLIDDYSIVSLKFQLSTYKLPAVYMFYRPDDHNNKLIILT